MKRLIGMISLSLIVVVLSGCATQTFLLSGANSTLQYEESQTFFAGGISQESEVNAADICGGLEKVAKVETELSAIDAILTYFTSYIYAPRTARVYCLN